VGGKTKQKIPHIAYSFSNQLNDTKMKLNRLLQLLSVPFVTPFVVLTRERSHTSTLTLRSSTKLPPVKNETKASIDDNLLSYPSSKLDFQEPSFPKTLETIKVKSGRKELWFDESSGRFYEAGGNEKIPIATLFERTLDTIEDAAIHARRIPYDKGWIDPPELEQMSRKTVVVLGSGWASHALMKVADTYKIRLIVVSPTNHFVFTPSKFLVFFGQELTLLSQKNSLLYLYSAGFGIGGYH
jgi:hypothetical protein